MQGGSKAVVSSDNEKFINNIDIMIGLLKSLKENSAQNVLNSSKKPEHLRWPMRVCQSFLDTVNLQGHNTTKTVNKLLSSMFELGASLYLPDTKGMNILEFHENLIKTNPTVLAVMKQLYDQATERALLGFEDASEVSQEELMVAITNDPDVDNFGEMTGSIIETIKLCVRKNIAEQLLLPKYKAHLLDFDDRCNLYISIEGEDLRDIHACLIEKQKSSLVVVGDDGEISDLIVDDDETSMGIRKRYWDGIFSGEIVVDINYMIVDLSKGLPQQFKSHDVQYYIDKDLRMHSLILKLEDADMALVFSCKITDVQRSGSLPVTHTVMDNVVQFSCLDVSNPPVVNYEMATFVLQIIKTVRAEAKQDRKEMRKMLGKSGFGDMAVVPDTSGLRYRLVGATPKCEGENSDAAPKCEEEGAGAAASSDLPEESAPTPPGLAAS